MRADSHLRRCRVHGHTGRPGLYHQCTREGLLFLVVRSTDRLLMLESQLASKPKKAKARKLQLETHIILRYVPCWQSSRLQPICTELYNSCRASARPGASSELRLLGAVAAGSRALVARRRGPGPGCVQEPGALCWGVLFAKNHQGTLTFEN